MMTKLRFVLTCVGLAGLGASLVACGGGAQSASPAASPSGGTSDGSSAATGGTTTITKSPPRADASVLPRKLIFGNPDRAAPLVSHDGKQIAWLAPKEGVLNVYVAPSSDVTKAKAVTDEKGRPIPSFNWAYDNKHIL